MNNPKTPEQVLVIPRATLEEIGSFQGFTAAKDYLSAFIDSREMRFVDRQEAEQNRELKQIIPYTLIMAPADQRVRLDSLLPFKLLSYARGKGGTEARLHAQISVGYGGHINPVDQAGDAFTQVDFITAVQRELSEELTPFPRGALDIIGFVNDDSTDVGSVHFGVVSIVHATNNAAQDQDGNDSCAFRCLVDLLVSGKLETWSELTLRGILASLYEIGNIPHGLITTLNMAWKPEMTLVCKQGTNLLHGYDAAGNLRRFDLEDRWATEFARIFHSELPQLAC